MFSLAHSFWNLALLYVTILINLLTYLLTSSHVTPVQASACSSEKITTLRYTSPLLWNRLSFLSHFASPSFPASFTIPLYRSSLGYLHYHYSHILSLVHCFTAGLPRFHQRRFPFNGLISMKSDNFRDYLLRRLVSSRHIVTAVHLRV